MSANNPNDLIEKILKDMKSSKNSKPLTDNELIDKLNTIDKNKSVKKLNEMGLGFLAQKMGKMSNDELISIVKNNPSLLKKINEYIK